MQIKPHFETEATLYSEVRDTGSTSDRIWYLHQQTKSPAQQRQYVILVIITQIKMTEQSNITKESFWHARLVFELKHCKAWFRSLIGLFPVFRSCLFLPQNET